MAGFGLTRVGSAADMAREWKPGKLVPLYLAGIAVGIAAGVGMTIRADDSSEAPFRPPAVAAPQTIAPVAETVFVAPPSSGAAVLENFSPPSIIFPEAPPAPPVAIAPVVEPAVPAAPVVAAKPVAVAPAVVPAPAPVVVKPVPVAESAPPPAPVAAAPKTDFYVPAVAAGAATSLEQRLFDGMNAERAKAGLAPYVYDAGLTTVARTRSQQMADQGYFGHVDPFGYSMYTALLKHFGYLSYAWAGENLAMNNYAASEASERSLITLMNSPTHRANILADDFFRVGVGEVTTADGRHIFAMIFLG